MKSAKLIFGGALAIFLLTGNFAMAQGHGNGHGKGQEKHGNDGEQGGHFDKGHERDSVREWYDEHEQQNNLPPGLAKKDRLPPGLEKQLERRGTLPPGLQSRLQPVPRDLEVRLPPPPPDCTHVLIGGHIVLLNQRTNIVVDVLHFEIH